MLMSSASRINSAQTQLLLEIKKIWKVPANSSKISCLFIGNYLKSLKQIQDKVVALTPNYLKLIHHFFKAKKKVLKPVLSSEFAPKKRVREQIQFY